MHDARDILIIELKNQIAALGSSAYLEVQKTCNKVCEERGALKRKVSELENYLHNLESSIDST
jgi:hypothetical protein